MSCVVTTVDLGLQLDLSANSATYQAILLSLILSIGLNSDSIYLASPGDSSICGVPLRSQLLSSSLNTEEIVLKKRILSREKNTELLNNISSPTLFPVAAPISLPTSKFSFSVTGVPDGNTILEY
jgi:hypothetical protein